MMTADDCAALIDEADRLWAAGAHDQAVGHLKARLAATGGCFPGWLRLQQRLFDAGRYAEAVAAARSAEEIDPHRAAFSDILAALQRRDRTRATALAEALLADCPGHPRALFTLARLAFADGDFEGAVERANTGLALSPADNVLRTVKIAALEQSGAYGGAVEEARTLVAVEETHDTLWTLITVLLRYGLNEDALDACNRIEPHCQGDPRRVSALQHVRGQVLRILGDRAGAAAAFNAAIAADPSNTLAWWGLADMKTYPFSPEDKQALLAVQGRSDLDRRRQGVAAFALARAYEVDGAWPAAMELYTRANALCQDAAFDADRFDAAIGRMVRAFTPETLAVQAPDADNDDPVPVFIVGLPRSGSTLVEQILASHSAIEGTIEQPTLPAVKRVAHLICARRLGGDYLDAIARLTADDLAALGAAYIRESRVFRREGAGWFTDKMPFNYEHVGLIHKILPRAVVIDVRRNPLDCGLSLYKQYFTQGTGFSCDLASIGRYYNGYLALMDHWDAVLPGKVLHVQYEELVHSTEAVVRRMLGRLGLEFEAECLAFHQTRRAVRTASSEQVRRPINDAGIGVWRQADAVLGPLKAALGPATLERFARHL